MFIAVMVSAPFSQFIHANILSQYNIIFFLLPLPIRLYVLFGIQVCDFFDISKSQVLIGNIKKKKKPHTHTTILLLCIYTLFIHSIQSMEWIVTDKKCNVFTWYDMRCWIRCSFRHQTTDPKISALIESISVIDCRIRDWMDKMSMNRPLLYSYITDLCSDVAVITQFGDFDHLRYIMEHFYKIT